MSAGYGGNAKLILLDEDRIVYCYSSFNLNFENGSEYEKAMDGEIIINRKALAKLAYKETDKWHPSSRLQERMRKDASFFSLYESGEIDIRNASGTWKKNKNGVDTVALRLLGRIEDSFRKNGIIPEKAAFF